jgi:hypothetical protein
MIRERAAKRRVGPARPTPWTNRRVLVFTLAALVTFLGCAQTRASKDLPQQEIPAGDPGGKPVAEPSIFEGAGSSLVPLAPTRVRRRIEDLTLRREGDRWRVEAVDVFESGASPEAVLVGLPDFEGVSDTGGRRSTLSDVTLTVDGVEIAPTLEPPPMAADLGSPGGIGRIYSWRLQFAPEERKVIRLRYRLVPSRTRQGDELLFFYLNTGTPWFGESGRINVRVELDQPTTGELVLGWLRPRNFGVRPNVAIWQLADEEPTSDLVLALRPFQNPLDGYQDRALGLLELAGEQWPAVLERSTPREWEFWRAYLHARRGEPPAEEDFRALFEAETWYAPKAEGELPREWSEAEESLFELLTEHMREWERVQLPSPDELRLETR